MFIIISKYFWSSKVDLVKFFSSFYGCTCKQDISEWEEDADEYIRKNLPSELVWERMIFLNLWITILVAVFTFFFSFFGIQEEISGWREDLFTARKSAINLLGVISVSKVGTGLKSELYICPQNYHLGCYVMPAGASNGNT